MHPNRFSIHQSASLRMPTANSQFLLCRLATNRRTITAYFSQQKFKNENKQQIQLARFTYGSFVYVQQFRFDLNEHISSANNNKSFAAGNVELFSSIFFSLSSMWTRYVSEWLVWQFRKRTKTKRTHSVCGYGFCMFSFANVYCPTQLTSWRNASQPCNGTPRKNPELCERTIEYKMHVTWHFLVFVRCPPPFPPLHADRNYFCGNKFLMRSDLYVCISSQCSELGGTVFDVCAYGKLSVIGFVCSPPHIRSN